MRYADILAALVAVSLSVIWFFGIPALRRLWSERRHLRHVRYPVPVSLVLSQSAGDPHDRSPTNDHRQLHRSDARR